MKISEYKEVTKKESVTIGYKCDNCGEIHIGVAIPNSWHEFNGHHHSWGNDSIESYEYYLACSPECYAKLLQKAVNDFERYNDAEIDDFEIDFAKRLSEFLNTINT